MKTKVNSITKMNPAQKKIWTAALRSGKFKQGKGSLVVDDGGGKKHCCLGVAQCVLGDRAPSGDAMMLRKGRFGLSGSVQAALASANDGNSVQVQFAKIGKAPPRLNTKGRATFTEIANWVDKNL